jgi:hypothetical protein
MKVANGNISRLAGRWSVLLLAAFPVFVSAQARNLPPTPEQIAQDREDRGPEPIVDIDSPPADSKSAVLRNERNRQHNSSGHQLQEPAIGEEEEAGIAMPQHARTALPVSQSDTIVIGDVVKATAFLSEAKDMVYSEFQVRVTQVLMNQGPAMQNGDSFDAERGGGGVRFPSGRIWRFRSFEQGMPKVGGRYLLFLKAKPATANFDIVTGYLLQNGKVRPLDGMGFHHNPAAALPCTKYIDADEEKLRDDVDHAIRNGEPKGLYPRT